MKQFRHGLFIGKFYPPHQGHHRVIRAAAERCERVTVVVMASVAETIDLADRVRWLRAEHAATPSVQVVGVRCDAPLDLGDEQVWVAQIAVMAAAVRTVGTEPVDAVFSADHYGRELAERFKAEFVGLERALSATAVRRDLAGTWPALAPATRAGMATRVVVLGAESTGTTTISRQLADHYRRRGGVWADTGWVGEYGRDYTYLKWDAEKTAARCAGRPEPALDAMVWNAEDFDRVAAEQTAAEERAARAGSPLLICDTDAFATTIWERRYLGAEARSGPGWSRPPLLPPRHLYLLTDHHGVPWSDDGLREGDLAIRAAMTDWFADALTSAGHSWVLLSGSLPQRFGLAVRAVDQLLAYRMSFGAPLRGPGFD
jgi:HTH-type transcriptional repressor of NAD biosynthesis genes